MRPIRLLALAALFLTPAALLAQEAPPAAPPALRTDPARILPDYVAKEDPSFSWKVFGKGELQGLAVAELRLVSQTWRGIPWKHRLLVARPKEVREPSQAVLIINGGAWKAAWDEAASREGPLLPSDLPRGTEIAAMAAQRVGCIVAVVSQVPFQPMFDGKKEDELIAHTFLQYVQTREPDWPLLLPMTKSAVKAMDAVQQFAKAEWAAEVKSFVVTGGSKRGWTTWLTGAVDPRVNAIAPMVIDNLNVGAQMKHQIETWGAFSEQIADYTVLGLQRYLETPVGREVMGIVDPWSYRERLTMPKLIVNGTNDRYWCLDALNLYWDDLRGEKHVLYCPNQGHGIADIPRLVGGVAALTRRATGRIALPKLAWEYGTNGTGVSLRVRSDPAPVEFSAWTTTSATKDFRNSRWEARPVAAGTDGAFAFDLARPTDGYAALFGEAVYTLEDGLRYQLSTQVRIVRGRQGEDF
ncbi:MAG: PhoPQ-activated pathogenicity-related family protein [Planctomycetales bacterium]|nr:PhoPQ-activated pathogenicity-related family protein [Planctomycetales bacterium]